MIQIPLADTNRFLSVTSKGNQLSVEVESEKYNVLLKQVTRESVTQQVEHIEFQHLVADEAVNSVATIVLTNREKNPNLVQQHIETIPYNALPKDFVQEVVIDLDGMEAGSSVLVKDLDIAQNENIKLTIAEDIAVLTVSGPNRAALTEETENEAEGAQDA